MKVVEESVTFDYIIKKSFVEQRNWAQNGYPVNIEFVVGLKENNSSNPEKLTIQRFELKDGNSKVEENKALIDEIKSHKINGNKTQTTEDIVQSANLIETLVKNDNFTVSDITKAYNTTISIQSDGKLSTGISIVCDEVHLLT